MYQDAFEMDWVNLTQEEAMFRAFALGVDAAFGNQHPEERRRLEREFHRGLIQIAFDEGYSRATDELRARGVHPDGEEDDVVGGEHDTEVWADLVTAQRSDPEAFESVPVRRGRDRLPEALSRPKMLEFPGVDPDTLELPRFLFR
ncbi:MAG: hypothetical protein ABEI31_10015 [Halodesulfurarchaeum sp.]